MLYLLLVASTVCTNELKDGEQGYCERRWLRDHPWAEEVPDRLRPRGFDPYVDPQDWRTEDDEEMEN